MSVIHSPNPVSPRLDQKTYDLKEAKTVSEMLQAIEVDYKEPQHVVLNNKSIPREEWDTTEVKPDDVVNVIAYVHGGDSSNPIAVVATLALIAFAPWAGGTLATTVFGAASTTGFVASATSAAILVGGSYVINALFPPPTPEGSDGLNVSPTYNIQGSRNRARQRGVIPIVCGRHKVIPDLGALPFTRHGSPLYGDIPTIPTGQNAGSPRYRFFGLDLTTAIQSQVDDDASYLYQLFEVCMNPDVIISEEKIGNEPLDNYDGVEIEISDGSTGEITLFPTNVDSEPGGLLTKEGGFLTRTTSIDTTLIEFEIQAALFRFNSKGDLRENSVWFEVQYRPAGGTSWLPFFDDPPPESYNWGGVTNPLLIRSSSQDPYRRSFARAVDRGQYEFRIRRLSDDEEDGSRRTSTTSLSQLKSYQADTFNYGGRKRIGLRVKASGQLSGVIDQFNCIVSAETEIWNPSLQVWEFGETSNPAWWFLHIARGATDVFGRRKYGAGLPDSQIDLDEIKAWGAWCDANQLEFNHVFNSAMSVYDMLQIVARVGRASVSYQSGKLGVVYDEENRPITQLFGMSNIVANTYVSQWQSENLADEIVLTFNNPDKEWGVDEVRARIPGATTTVNPIKINVPGITNLNQAQRDANLLAAQQVYRRRRISFETDIEGLAANKGDVVSVSHDLSQFDVSGRLELGSTDTQLVLSRPVSFDEGPTGDYNIQVRHPDQTIEVVPVQYSASETDTITLLTPLSANPAIDTDNREHDYLFQFGPQPTPGKKFKIVSIVPQGTDGNRVSINLVDEEPDYYAYENEPGDYDSGDRFNTDSALVEDVTFTEELIRKDGPSRVTVRWTLQNASGVRLRIREGLQGWVDYGERFGSSFVIDVDDVRNPVEINVELSPIAINPTRQTTIKTFATYNVQGNALNDDALGTLPDVTGLQLKNQANDTEFTGSDANFEWTDVSIDLDDEQIANQTTVGGFQSATTNSSSFKHYEVTIRRLDGTVARRETTTDNFYTYTFTKNADDNANEPLRDFTIEVVQVAFNNQRSQRPAKLTVNNPAPEVPGGITTDAAISTIFIDTILPTDRDFEGIIVWGDTVSGFTPTGIQQGQGNVVYRGRGNVVSIIDLLSDTTYYFRLAGFDGFGFDEPSDLNISSEFSEATVSVDVPPNSITETELADDSVSTPKLQANSVTANEVTTGLLITLNSQMGNAVIDRAQLAVASVGEAEIEDLNVTTLKIDGNAVTQTEYTENTTDIVVGNTLTQINSINGIVVPVIGPLGTEPTRVSLTWMAFTSSDNQQPPNITWQVRRTESSTGGSGSATLFNEQSNLNDVSWSYTVDDLVLPGTYNYILECQISSNRTIFRSALAVNFIKK